MLHSYCSCQKLKILTLHCLRGFVRVKQEEQRDQRSSERKKQHAKKVPNASSIAKKKKAAKNQFDIWTVVVKLRERAETYLAAIDLPQLNVNDDEDALLEIRDKILEVCSSLRIPFKILFLK